MHLRVPKPWRWARDEELAASLVADNRVLLAVTPAKPASEWSVLGVEA